MVVLDFGAGRPQLLAKAQSFGCDCYQLSVAYYNTYIKYMYIIKKLIKEDVKLLICLCYY